MATLVVGAGGFATIQAAVNAANVGDTIRISAGTYNEDVTVNKSGLTITNAPGEAVVLNGVGGGWSAAIQIATDIVGTTVIGDAAANFVINGSAGQIAAFYLVQNNDATNVSGVTIVSNNAAGNALLTGGQIDNVTFANSAFNGVAAQLVYVNGPASLGGPPENNVNFINNQFNGNAGLILGLESATGVIQGNTFTGTASTVIGLQEPGYIISGNTFDGPAKTYVGGSTYPGATTAAANNFPDGYAYIEGKPGVFGTIQRAVDRAADGDTIRVSAGTFTENVTINKDVTIVGANEGVAGDDAGRGAETVINGAVRATVDGITFDGFKITGSAFKTDMGLDANTGFVVAASNVVVKNSILDGAASSDPNNDPWRPAATTGPVTNLSFTDNKVTNWDYGFYVVNGHTGAISNNTFVNNGNAVVTESTGVTISNNHIEGSAGSDVAIAAPGGATIDVSAYVFENTFGAARPGKVGFFPTAGGPQKFIGTDVDDGFYGDYGAGQAFEFEGGAGNDRAFSGKGNDKYDGGVGGNDTAVFQGPRSEYTITQSGGVVTVVHTTAGGDGTDTLTNFENFEFDSASGSPQTFTFAQLFPPPPSSGGGGSTPTTPTTPTNPTPTTNDPADGTIPSLVVSSFVIGTIPTSGAKLDELSNFAELQYQAYQAKGVADPGLGPYEALGVGFAETTEFQTKYGAQSEGDFISQLYQAVFGRAATVDQQDHFQHQIDYFEAIYAAAKIPEDKAELMAKGAVLGQMLGFAVLEEGNTQPYLAQAQAFIADAADGSVEYGKPLAAYELV